MRRSQDSLAENNSKSTLHLIEALYEEIDDRMGAMNITEISDSSRFEYADQIFAYAGLSPSTYQSGQLTTEVLGIFEKLFLSIKNSFYEFF